MRAKRQSSKTVYRVYCPFSENRQIGRERSICICGVGQPGFSCELDVIVGTQFGRLEPRRKETKKKVRVCCHVEAAQLKALWKEESIQLTIPEERGPPWQGGLAGRGEHKLEVEHTVRSEPHLLHIHTCANSWGQAFKRLSTWGVHFSFKPLQRGLFQTSDILNDFYNEIPTTLL